MRWRYGLEILRNASFAADLSPQTSTVQGTDLARTLFQTVSEGLFSETGLPASKISETELPEMNLLGDWVIRSDEQ
jgi:hypothetical protein